MTRKGEHHSPETRAKLSAARKGKHHSAETRAKMSAALKGHPGFWLGKHLSAEHRAKFCDRQGQPKSPVSIHVQGAARHAVALAIKQRQLARVTVCGLADGSCKGKIEAHHYLGYAPEHWLDVQWLCVRHHRIEHYGHSVLYHA